MFKDDWCPVRIIFWPSVTEIKECKSPSLYSGGLKEYLKSFIELEGELWKADIRAGVPAGRGKVRRYSSGKKGAGAYPDVFINFIVFIGSTGIAAGLYNILKLWAEKKNGRKIKVRIGEFEVEVTQMSEEEFLKFFEKLLAYKQTVIENPEIKFNPAKSRKLYAELMEAGYKVQREGSIACLTEASEVAGVAMDSIMQQRNKTHDRSSKSKSDTQKSRKNKHLKSKRLK